MIQIFGTTKSFDTKKAQMWFKERRIPFQFIDLKEKEMSAGEFESVIFALAKQAGCKADAIESLIDKKIKIMHQLPILMMQIKLINFLKIRNY